MKLKQSPDDFQVEEITSVVAGDEGPFALYRLTKTGWSTPDALAAVRRRWQLDLRRLSYGGLKDRHARTTQYLTIFKGPRRNLTHHGIEVRYLGQTTSAYTSADIARNRFQLLLREIKEEERPAIEGRLAQIAAQGVPNYFDDQRFGSAGPEGFMARHLVLGQFEQALRLALTAPYEHDRAAQKEEKALLTAHWGDWATLKDRLPRGHARSLVDYLRVHPADFRGAVVRLRPELRGLYLSAYQSHLWNRVLAQWVTTHVPAERVYEVPLRLGAVPFHHDLEPAMFAELERLQLPLATARWKPEPEDPR